MSVDTVSDVVRYEQSGAVTTLTIAHPPANAISRAVVEGIRAGLEKAIEDEECRAVILTGDGERFFAAGADVREFVSASDDVLGTGLGITREIEGARMPVIAAING